MEGALVVVFVLVITVIIFMRFMPEFFSRTDKKGEQKEGLPELAYLKKQWMMSAREWETFRNLEARFGVLYWIFPQVRLSNLVFVETGSMQWKGQFNRISQKTIDFALIEKSSRKTVLAIELDDASHGYPSRRARDQFAERVLKMAGVPLVRLVVGSELMAVEQALEKREEDTQPRSSALRPRGRSGSAAQG